MEKGVRILLSFGYFIVRNGLGQSVPFKLYLLYQHFLSLIHFLLWLGKENTEEILFCDLWFFAVRHLRVQLRPRAVRLSDDAGRWQLPSDLLRGRRLLPALHPHRGELLNHLVGSSYVLIEMIKTYSFLRLNPDKLYSFV